jgi:hypothetical protein
MILDSHLGVTLLQNGSTYVVTDNGRRWAFRGETAYADAQDKMSELINIKMYN